MLDSGDNAFVYAGCKEAIEKKIKGTENITLEELNNHFSNKDIEKANNFKL